MEFPKKSINDLQANLQEFFERQQGDSPGTAPLYVTNVDPKDLEELIMFAELANARIKELENDCSGLMFKLRCVAQALK
tara:strand:- start:1409 stop:1645 length:237 start_codon:yes stop_codon:yes gene_type:complete